MSTLTIQVEGMTCGGCEASITRVLSALNGVTSVRASHKSGEVVLSLSADVDDAAVSDAVDRAGFKRVG